MPDIIGNDMSFDRPLTADELMSASQQFSRRALLDRSDNFPRLIINGENDYFVPKDDTLDFLGRRDTEVVLIPGIFHCGILGGPRKCR